MERQPNSFFIDLLNILPQEVECFIQAPSLENTVVEAMLQNSEFDYFKVLTLDVTKKKEIVRQEIETFFSGSIQSIEIKKSGVLLFEGYDGVEFGSISREVFIPDWFKEKYSPNNLMGFF
jgi:hypothetical protein